MNPTQAQARLGKLLHRFQKVGANYLYGRHAALLADEMGLGKTIQALAAIRPDEGTIVVCPAFLMLNWENETKKFRPDLAIVPFDPERFPTPGQLAITAYSRLPDARFDVFDDCSDLSKSIPRWAFGAPSHATTLILDEAHYVKSSQSQRTHNVRALASVCERAWALTGTPMVNRPPELWALLQALKWSAKDVFGSWDNLVRVFSARKKKFGGYAWGVVLPEAKERLDRFMLRRTRAEVMSELPKKSHREIVVPIARQGLLGQDFRFIDEWSDARVEDESRPEGTLFQVRKEISESKHGALEELIEEYEDATEPVVVFASHLPLVNHLHDRKGWAIITGDVSVETRQARVDSFQDGYLRGLAGTTGAMGVGFTLTKACHAVFVDRPWTPGEEDQAEDRLCRIGQTRPVLITRLVGDHPVERRVAKVIENKREMLKEIGLS